MAFKPTWGYRLKHLNFNKPEVISLWANLTPDCDLSHHLRFQTPQTALLWAHLTYPRSCFLSLACLFPISSFSSTSVSADSLRLPWNLKHNHYVYHIYWNYVFMSLPCPWSTETLEEWSCCFISVSWCLALYLKHRVLWYVCWINKFH